MKDATAASFPAPSDHAVYPVNTASSHASARLALRTTVESRVLDNNVKCIASFTSSSIAAPLNMLRTTQNSSLLLITTIHIYIYTYHNGLKVPGAVLPRPSSGL